MEIVPCGKGHFYDKSLGSCPQCAAEAAAAAGGAATIPDYGKTMPTSAGPTVPDSGNATFSGFEPIGATEPVNVRYPAGGYTAPATNPGFTAGDFNGANRANPAAGKVEDYSPTQPANFQEVGYFDPIVGWLVCVDGPSRGQDYRLHTGNNRIGRSPKNNIYLQGDPAVSEEDSGIVGYDDRSGRFYFAAGAGKNLTYVNKEVIFGYVEIHAYDVITVGNTDLMFVPLCGEKFTWKK